MEFLMIILMIILMALMALMAKLLLAVVFRLGLMWGAWSEFPAKKNNWQEMDK